MATADEVLDSLLSFAQTCNENQRLLAMNKDWRRVIHIHATDLNTDYTLVSHGTRVDASNGVPPAPDMIVQTTSDILTEIFYGEVSPNEPYNAGTLRVQGTEADILHLDFITAMLWG
jgi:putative sterol carrier protein